MPIRSIAAWISLGLCVSTVPAAEVAPGGIASAQTQPWPTIRDAVDPKNDTQPARVNSVNFYGNEKLPTSVLIKSVGIQPGELMQKEKMGAAMDRIVAAYKARGWDVEVRPRVSHPKQNAVDVNFLINEQGKGGHD